MLGKIFQTPRRKQKDTVGSYNRRVVPWIALFAVLMTLMMASGASSATAGWVLTGLLWVMLPVYAFFADWSSSDTDSNDKDE